MYIRCGLNREGPEQARGVPSRDLPDRPASGPHAEPLRVKTAPVSEACTTHRQRVRKTQLELCPAGERRGRGALGRRRLRRELRVAGRGEPSPQVLENVQGQAADQSDHGHLPQERQSGDEVHICKQMGRPR